MKYLSDKEILSWNKRLSNSRFIIKPISNFENPYNGISICKKTHNYSPIDGYNNGDNIINGDNTIINYNYIFSVSRKRKDEFLDLINKLLEEEFVGYTYFLNNRNEEIINDFKLNKNIINSIFEIDHQILNVDYIRYEYRFSGLIQEIMAYVMYLEDAMNFFQKIWKYDENGKEIHLIKYPIGTLVTLNNDSDDYLVVDYKYIKLDGIYHIDYILSKILYIGTIIKYSDAIISKETDISYSRNYRINEIFNN